MTPDFERINRLFFEKLLAEQPNHPWKNQAPLPPWDQPRRTGDHWRMDLNIWEAPGVLARCGRVRWNADGSGHYSISITAEAHGFPCFPDYHALSDAQDAVEELIRLPLDELKRRNGQEWPNVVK